MHTILSRWSGRRWAGAALAAALVALVGFEVACQLEAHAMRDDAQSPTLAEGAACSLPADELAQRKALYARDVIPLVSTVEHDDDLLRLTMNTDEARTKAIAERMAELEAGCCSFMTIHHATDVGPNAIEIHAPEHFLKQILDWGWPEPAEG